MDMFINMTVVWLAVFVVLLVIEIVTMGLTTIWFAGGAAVAAIASALHAPFGVQILLFLVVSLVLLYFTRPIAIKYFNKDRVKTNVEGMIGNQAIVTSEIDNQQGIGQVTLNGLEWTARTLEDGIILPVGCVVTVEDVQGVKLIVQEKQ